MFLTRISVGQPVFATMMMLALVVMGAFSYERLAVEQFPDIDFPVVVVTTAYAGASPETVESEVTRPIENAVNTISAIDSVTSRSYQGRSVVIVQFKLDKNSETAAQDVRDKLSVVEATFNKDIDHPQITRFDPDSQPIASIAVTSDTVSLRDLTALATDTIVKRLNTVPGVGQANVVGGITRQINILVDEGRMHALNVGINDVLNALQSQNQDLPAGTITYGIRDRTVQVQGKMVDPQTFLKLVVARRGGQPVYMSQIATVEDGHADITSRALLDGKPALAIDVVKIQGSNTIGVVAGLRTAMADLQKNGLPPSVKLDMVRDNARGIRNSVNDVESTVIEGAILAVLIVFLFLNSWRSTVITGLTLPVSVIGTFSVLYFLGYTLNTMTLMALSLAIGILIDDAIVVRENITRHLHMGKSHRQAALDGTNEIGLAVLATSLSIIAVFLPVAFMGGIIGRFFLQFGVTVCVSVLISLFVSFTLDPMLSSVWYDPASHAGAKRGIVGRLVQRFDDGFQHFGNFYQRVLGWSLRHRLMTLGVVVVLFAVTLWGAGKVGVEFVPDADLGEFQVAVTAPVGSSLDYTTVKARQVEAAIRSFPEVASTYTTVNAGGARGTNEAIVNVELVAISKRKRTPTTLAAPIRKSLASIPGVKAAIQQPAIGGNQKPIQVSLLGDNIDQLKSISAKVEAELKKIPGAADVDSSLEDEKPIIGVHIKRDIASDLGVSIGQIATTLRTLIAGDLVTTWEAPNDETYDVVVQLPKDARTGVPNLGDLSLTTATPGPDGTPNVVPLSAVADVVQSVGPNEIDRRDLTREVVISANPSAGHTVGEISTALQKKLTATPLPPGYRFWFGGDTKNLNESIGYAASALLLAVVFIYLVLASQFGSFLQPLAIMASLPLSLIGVVGGLAVAGSTLNLFSAIGFIMLMGLVTKNAILLVDFVNQRRKEGVELHEALLQAGSTRLRPIIMTTMAMIFGMLPLALGLGEGGSQRAPMAHAVIGGLISSTLLTLVVVPVVLTYLDGLARRLRPYLPKAPKGVADESDAGNVLPLPGPRHI